VMWLHQLTTIVCLSVSVIDSVKDRTPLLGFVVQLAVDLLRELTTNRQLKRCRRLFNLAFN